MTDPLQCTWSDAERNHLRDGIALSTADKVDFFEEMVSLAVRFGARDRLLSESIDRRRVANRPDETPREEG